MNGKAYYKANTLEDAIRLLRSIEGPRVLLAGGTDVLVNGRDAARYADASIIDIYGIPELCGIREEADAVIIGAGATHSQIAESPLVRRYAGVLADACRSVGSQQIRNHATIGGNIGNASPAADSFAALAVLDAIVEINRLGEVRRIPLAEVIHKPYRTTLTPEDLITAVIVKKLPQTARCRFYKLGRRKALSIARMTIAAVLDVAPDGVVRDFVMTMGATFPKPLTFPDINAMLIGKRPTEADVAATARALAAKIPEIAGIRASTAYKQPVCEKLCGRILKSLLEV